MQNQIIEHPASMESRLAESGRSTVEYARSLIIDSNDAYAAAGEFLREIKRRGKEIESYWSGPKAKAAAAHKEIAAKEKAMAAPLSEAEKIIRNNMVTYQAKIDAERRAAEAELRRKQQEERDRLLAEAVEAERAGDALSAQTNMVMAEMVEDMTALTMHTAQPAAAGISTRKAWKARIVNADAVPVIANGVMLRPVDTKALKSIARLTKGTATIPGVEFYEDSTLAVR